MMELTKPMQHWRDYVKPLTSTKNSTQEWKRPVQLHGKSGIVAMNGKKWACNSRHRSAQRSQPVKACTWHSTIMCKSNSSHLPWAQVSLVTQANQVQSLQSSQSVIYQKPTCWPTGLSTTTGPSFSSWILKRRGAY